MKERPIQIFSAAVDLFHILRPKPHLSKIVNDLSMQLAGLEEISKEHLLSNDAYIIIREALIEIPEKDRTWLAIADAIDNSVKRGPELTKLQQILNGIRQIVKEREVSHNRASIEIGRQGIDYTPAGFIDKVSKSYTQDGFSLQMYGCRPLSFLKFETIG